MPSGPLRTDQGERLVDAARVGIGIAQVFDFMVAEDLSAGRLVSILEDIATDGPPIQALMRGAAARTQRVRAVVDLLSTEMRRVLRR